MSEDAIQPGSRVRVRQPQKYIATYERKIRDRVGTVERLFEVKGWSGRGMAIVVFDARRKGSPEFKDSLPISALEIAP